MFEPQYRRWATTLKHAVEVCASIGGDVPHSFPKNCVTTVRFTRSATRQQVRVIEANLRENGQALQVLCQSKLQKNETQWYAQWYVDSYLQDDSKLGYELGS